MKSVFCISGKAQNGKDTVANMLQESLQNVGYKVLVTHYADLLKYICKTFFNWDGKKTTEGRTLLQKVGTDTIRSISPDFWVNFIIDILTFFENEWDYVIIPDSRFPNEIFKLKEAGFDTKFIRVIREGFVSPLTEEQQKHISETALDNYTPDKIIYNNIDNLKELNKQVDCFVNELIK